jgi:hypothetical protein
MNGLTVGDLRKAIEGLTDDAPVYPDFSSGHYPDDSEPGVEILGAVKCGPGCGRDTEHLSIRVALFYLNDGDEDDGEEGDDEVEPT